MKLIAALTLSLFTTWAVAAGTKRIVFIGDSLTEGYGVMKDQSYPSLLQKRADKDKKNWTVVNAGVSGSTSASATSRVAWHLKQKPDLIILALGANDGLRGTDTEAIETNLAAAIDLCKKQNVVVLLAGMKMPPNYGKEYKKKFEIIYPRLASRFQIPLLPFLLDGVAGKADMNLADGIHPNEKGHVIIADKLYPVLAKIL